MTGLVSKFGFRAYIHFETHNKIVCRDGDQRWVDCEFYKVDRDVKNIRHVLHAKVKKY